MLEILSERSELRSSYIQHFLSAINFREVVFFHNFFVLSTCRKCWISVRFAPLLRRFWFFCSVQRAPTTALVDAASIKLAANDGVAKTNILYAAAAHEYHRVLLQIMPFTRDIGGDFHAVGESYSRDLSDCTVWLARRLGGNTRADATLEGRWVEGRTIFQIIKTTAQGDRLLAQHSSRAPLSCELIYRCHLK